MLDITHYCQHEASSSLSDSHGAECLRRRRKQGKTSIYFAWYLESRLEVGSNFRNFFLILPNIFSVGKFVLKFENNSKN